MEYVMAVELEKQVIADKSRQTDGTLLLIEAHLLHVLALDHSDLVYQNYLLVIQLSELDVMVLRG